ncbi:cyclophane-containing peptide 2OG-Fe(II) oxygenase YhhC [uncultured Enterovirga sp.]|uniref:cyclophane-containing peptide 2OG-Fe(II) oxygenase YhhC n=1 Tax=uncultured Enterovirga sp. TaxID=2026352 RepID=UPI0035C9F795
MTVKVTSVPARAVPFPHSVSGEVMRTSLAKAVLEWFETEAPWRLRSESFYEQYELNLHQAELPSSVAFLVSPEFVGELAARMLLPLTSDPLLLVEANAHKLLPGQTIKIHNDYIDGEESHRILVQVNREWSDANGGLLMFFSGPAAGDVARVIRPLHRSGTAFEISPRSFHAVSTIHAGERYTVVYSFKPSR